MSSCATVGSPWHTPPPPPSHHQGLVSIQEYYGRVLQRSEDLRTSACCAVQTLPGWLHEIVSLLHPEVVERFYGCGIIAPSALEGRVVLDLGCGSGRDAYVLSALVGPQGEVIGVDMTAEQLAVARRHQAFHAAAFGHEQSNIRFLQGYIEDLGEIEDESVDVVVSNCVVNLSPAKDRVFAEIFRVLRPGGELHFSDVYADRRLPAELREDPVLLGECLAGAMYGEDLRRTLAAVGCEDARTLVETPIAVTDEGLVRRIGPARFVSRTVRAFKIQLEDRCEDHGQVATYKGGLPDQPHVYKLDDHHALEAGRPMLVCGNTAAMLQESRLAPWFDIQGDRSRHFGLFDCAPAPGAEAGASCC